MGRLNPHPSNPWMDGFLWIIHTNPIQVAPLAMTVDLKTNLKLISIMKRNTFSVSGWSMFKLEKELFLSFSAGLLSFSVLFAQLSGANI